MLTLRACGIASRRSCIQLYASRRLYHSYEHDTPSPFTDAEEDILSAALPYVPSHGFTTAALTAGAKDSGYIDASINLFPSGAFALVNYHLVTQRLALRKHTPNPNDPNVLGRIREITLERLRANKPIIHRWQEALAILASPEHFSTSVRELALLSDEIHFLAGDKSVDSSWYTKRAGLSAIYASTELFMTQDQSPNFVETEEFLDRRLKGAQQLSSAAADVETWLGVQGMGIVNGLRSKGVRI